MKRFLVFSLLCTLFTVAFAQRKSATEEYYKAVYEDIPYSQMKGNRTYSYIYDEDGTKLLDGPFSIKCNQPTQTYNYGGSRITLSGSFTLNTSYSKGNLNGSFTAKYLLNCHLVYGFRNQRQTCTASITAGFANGIPNGVFKIAHDNGSKSTLSATYKNGVLVGPFSCSLLDSNGRPAIYSGTLTQTGKPTGIWKIDDRQYEFLNGVLLSRSSDESVNPRTLELAKKYANGTITEEELAAQNVVLHETVMSLNSYVLTAVKQHSGVDFSNIKGWDFSQCQRVVYVELREIPALNDRGVQCLVKDRLAIELGEYHEPRYIVCDYSNTVDKYNFLYYNEERQHYYLHIYKGSNTHNFVTCDFSSYPGSVYISDSQYQYIDSVFTASRVQRSVSLRDALISDYPYSNYNKEIALFFSNNGNNQFSEEDLLKIRKELVNRIDNFKKESNNFESYIRWYKYNSNQIVYINPNTLQDGDTLLQQIDNAIYKLRAESAWTLSNLLSEGFRVYIKDKHQLETYLSLLQTHEAPNLPLEQLLALRKTFATILEEYNTQSVENDYYAEWEYDFDGNLKPGNYWIKAGSEADVAQIIENLTSAINVNMFNNIVATFDFMVKKGKAESIIKDKKFSNFFTCNSQNPEWKTQALAALEPFCKLTAYDIVNLTENTVVCKLFVKQKKQQVIYEVELQHTNGLINIESFDISKAKLTE